MGASHVGHVVFECVFEKQPSLIGLPVFAGRRGFRCRPANELRTATTYSRGTGTGLRMARKIGPRLFLTKLTPAGLPLNAPLARRCSSARLTCRHSAMRSCCAPTVPRHSILPSKGHRRRSPRLSPRRRSNYADVCGFWFAWPPAVLKGVDPSWCTPYYSTRRRRKIFLVDHRCTGVGRRLGALWNKGLPVKLQGLPL
jgi:hypothetical protein